MDKYTKESIQMMRKENLRIKIQKRLSRKYIKESLKTRLNKWLEENPEPTDKQKLLGMLTVKGYYRVRKRNENGEQSSIKFAFWYYSSKKGLKCEFPYVFNDKAVIGFNEDLRPIGKGNVDLIDDYWASVEGGFSVNGDLDTMLNKWSNN